MNAEHEAGRSFSLPRFFIKELSTKQIAEIFLSTFFFISIAATAAVAAPAVVVQLKILLS